MWFFKAWIIFGPLFTISLIDFRFLFLCNLKVGMTSCSLCRFSPFKREGVAKVPNIRGVRVSYLSRPIYCQTFKLG